MTPDQARHTKTIIVTALAILALAGCGKVAASTTATSGRPAAATALPVAAHDTRLAKTYDITFDNLTYSETSDGTLTNISVHQSGHVSGYMTVNPPLYGTGSLSGTLKGSIITFTSGDGDYTGTVDESTLQISGTYTYPGQNGNWTAVPAGTPAPTAAGQVDCTGQNPSACLLASNAVAGLDIGDDSDAPTGMHMTTYDLDQDGFAGAEFTDGQGNIIIANEDADLASPFGTATPYQNSSLLASTAIYAGLRPAALNTAVQFAQQVAATSQNARIYVTGFGLGGAEAEAQAQALGSRVTGGVTFGAPGLPGYQGSGSPSTVTNFVDYGDPVGNWASDPQSELADLAAKNTDHYGGIDLIGNPLSAALPRLAGNTHKLTLSSVAEEMFGNNWNTKAGFAVYLKVAPVPESAFIRTYDLALDTASYAYLAGAAALYHSIAQYGQDLGVSLTPTVAPPATTADYQEFDPTASTATLQSAASTTVNPDGAVNASSYDLTADTATDELETQTFNDQSGSQYDVTYDPNEQISSLAVNDPGGTSYEISNDDADQQAWSSRVYFYSGPDETGTLTGVLYNWHAGGSQLKLFSGLPQGVSEETLDYSQPDATGTLLSKSSS